MRRSRSLGLRLACAAAGLTLLAAACGSSAKTAATKTTAAPAGVRGVTDSEVVLDVVAAVTSPQGATFPGFEDGNLLRVLVHANHVVAAFGQAGRGDQTDVPGSNDRDLH